MGGRSERDEVLTDKSDKESDGWNLTTIKLHLVSVSCVFSYSWDTAFKVISAAVLQIWSHDSQPEYCYVDPESAAQRRELKHELYLICWHSFSLFSVSGASVTVWSETLQVNKPSESKQPSLFKTTLIIFQQRGQRLKILNSEKKSFLSLNTWHSSFYVVKTSGILFPVKVTIICK